MPNHNIPCSNTGPLESVTEVRAVFHQDQMSLEWHPPFTLDLTNTDPDIQYTINVVRSGQILVQNYTITKPMDNLSVTGFDTRYVHKYFVIPRSNVEGAILGRISEAVPVLSILSELYTIQL